MKELLREWNRYLQEKESDIKTTEETKTITLPKFRISDQWGTPGSEDREIIETFTKKIKGSNFYEKVQSVNSFVAECDANCIQTKDVSEILASLIFLDSLASIIYDFNPMTGGFLFEAIVAALIGGSAHQVATTGGADQDTTDVVDSEGRNLSLKFFFESGSKYLGVSTTNLKAAIRNNGKPMFYLIGIKNRAASEDVLSIDFYEFSVGQNRPSDWNVIKDLPMPGREHQWERALFAYIQEFMNTLNITDEEAIKEIFLNKEVSFKNNDSKTDFRNEGSLYILWYYAEEISSDFKNLLTQSDIEKNKSAKKILKLYREIEQSMNKLEKVMDDFRNSKEYIPADFNYWQIEGMLVSKIIGSKTRGRSRKGEEGKPRKRKETNFYKATLNFGSREEIQKVANKYVERLGSTLTDIYSELDQLGKNINTYFANSPDSKTAGLRARENARILQVKTEELDE